MKEIEFYSHDILNEIYKNKSKCFILSDCLYKCNPYDRAQLYYEDKRIVGFVNRDYLRSDVLHWKDAEPPTLITDNNRSHNLKVDEEIDEIFLLYDDYEWQYGHFLMDMFPKMWYYIKLLETKPNLKIGVNSPILAPVRNVNQTEFVKYNTEFVEQFLKAYLTRYKLNYNERIIPLKLGKCYRIKNVYLPIPYTSVNQPPYPHRQMEMYDILKRDIPTISGFEKIYISRRDVSSKDWMHFRVLLNEDALIERLTNEGYREVRLMDYSVEEKIQIFKSAHSIVQLVGSNCYNLNFIEPGTKCAVLYHPYYACWSDHLKQIVENRGGKHIAFVEECKMVDNPNSYYPTNYNDDKKKIDAPWTFDGIDKLLMTMNDKHLCIKDCMYPWKWLHIISNGDVRPCCWYTEVIGNLNTQSFDEIWNGSQMQTLRQNIREGKQSHGCINASCKYVTHLAEGYTNKNE